MNKTLLLIEHPTHFKSIYYLLNRYYSKSLECIFYGYNQCLFRSNDIVYKISFHDKSIIYNFGSIHFGKVYEMIQLENGHTLFILEYIKNMLTNEYIFSSNKVVPFILLYSVTIDYLSAISILHNYGKIHSNIKPLNLMINNNVGKLVGLDDLVEIVPKETYYFCTSGSIDYLAPERFKYFKEVGFFGMTSVYSDIWELFYSILCIIDVIDVDEFFYLLYHNDNLLEYYLLNRFVKIFRMEYTNPLIYLVSKYVSLCVIGLEVNPIKRKKANYYLEKLIGYRNIVC